MRTGLMGLGLLGAVAVGLALPQGPVLARRPRSPSARRDAGFVPMTVREVRVFKGSHVVLLHSRDRRMVLPIWIGEREAQAIQMRLDRQRAPRPLTHDLLESVLAVMGVKLQRVEVNDLRDNVFIGKLAFKDAQGKHYRLDGRPSDLITLAVGASLPIHVAGHVLQKAGVKLDADPDATPPGEKPWPGPDSDPIPGMDRGKATPTRL